MGNKLKLKIAGGIAGTAVLAMAALVVLGVAALVIAALFMLDPWVERQVVERARERGIALQVGELDWGLWWVRVEQSKFSLIGVKGVRGEVESAEIDFDRFTPVGLDAKGIRVKIEGSAASLAFELSEWTKNYPRSYDLRVVAQDVSVVWRPDPAGPEWVKIEGGTIVPEESGGKFSAKQATVAGLSLGEVGAAWTKDAATVGLGFGVASPKDAPVRVKVGYAAERPTADITLLPTPLAKLAGPLALVLPVRGVTASAKSHLEFPPPGEQGQVKGAVHVELEGYVPPHPVELSGFIFGDTTTFDTEVTVAPDRQTVTLSNSRVKAGAFALKGRGQVTRQDRQARFQLDLRGDLACTALAGAAAQTHLGQVLGSLVGAVAKRALQGSVAVLVRIDADTSNLAAAKVVRTIGVGCGLKPVNPQALSALEEMADMLDLPGVVDALPTALPPLPSLPSAFPLPPPWPDRRVVPPDAGQ